MRSHIVLALGVAALLAAGCAGGDGAAATSSEPWTDTAMQTLVATKCATSGCHDGTQSPSFKNVSEASMRRNTEALDEVQAGKMPKRGTLTATEKQTFLSFFAGS